MKRIFLLMAIFMATGSALSLRAEKLSATPGAGVQDTITINLPDGVGMKIFVKDTGQLKALQAYKLDSLMALLNRYVAQVEEMEKNNKGARQVTMTFHPAKDLKNKQAPEQISITITTRDGERTTGRKVEQLVKVIVDINEQKKESRDSVQTRHPHKSSRSKFSFDVDLGLNTFARIPDNSGDAYDLKPLGSRYISLNNRYKARLGGQNSPFYLTTGFELAFNNLMLDKNRYVADVNGQTVFNKEPAEQRSFEKSKLAYSSLNLPLMATLQFKNKTGKTSFKIGAGGFAGYRLGSHTKLKYQEEGETVKDKDRGSYNLEDFQYGLNFVIGYRNVELFGKYNLNDLFRDNRGPALNVLSFGFRI